MSLFGNNEGNDDVSVVEDVRNKVNEILGLARHSLAISTEMREQIAEINARIDASNVVMMPRRPVRRHKRRIIREKE